MARVFGSLSLLLAAVAGVAVAEEAAAPAAAAVLQDTAFAAPIEAKAAVGSLRATAVAPQEPGPAKPAPYLQTGARVNFAVLVGLPIVLLLGMFVVKTKGGFYPFGAVCFVFLLLFVYTMVKSPYSYFA